MCDTSAGCYSGLYKFLNFSTQLNSSKREELLRVYWEEVAESKNQSEIPTALLIVTILVFLGMILFGTFGSSLVIYVILRKRSMRTRGNLFILNLAISDLTLCLITQPFNLLRLLTGNRNWVLGQFMCKFSAMFQGTNIFVSTFSITAIAIDRFQCIIYPTANRGSNNTAVNVNYLTWIIAFFLASPLVYFSRITELNHLQCTEKAENPITQKFKVAYSLAALIIQYMSPLVIVTIVYYRICLSIRDRKLRAMQKICLSQIVRNTTEQPNDKYELVMDTNSKSNQSACLNTNKDCHVTNNGNYDMYAPSNAKCPYYHKRVTSDKQGSAIQPLTTMLASSQKEVIDRRHRKAIILSTVIAIVFCLSWLPMNTLNVISDIRELVIITSIDVALTNLKYHDVEEQVLDNDTVNIESTSSESMFQHSTTSLKAINKIMSIEANNINAITVLITQAVCLLLILSSACINPILYGWLNQSFRAEFYQVLRVHSALMQNMRSSHKNVTPEISSNKNTGYRFINNEQADCIQRLPNNHIMNQLSTVDMQNEYYINFSLKNIHGPMKMHEKRSMSPAQDSCTVFSLFTSRSVELNSVHASNNSGSNKSTTNTVTNNNTTISDFNETPSQTGKNYFLTKNELSSTSNEISVQLVPEQEHLRLFLNNRSLTGETVDNNINHSMNTVNTRNVDSGLRRYLILNSNDDDECDIIPESESANDLSHLRYLPDITSV